MAKELLLEIGTEELPAGYIPPALDSLKDSARRAMEGARIEYDVIETCGTPRRIVLKVVGVAEQQEDLVEEQQGPASSVAFDADGHPTQAARGFAKSRGVALEELMVRETPRGEYVFARVFTPGGDTSKVLSTLLPDLIANLPFPKTMRWGSGRLRFARPIRWIVALLGDEIISFSCGEVRSGDQTYGHRQLSPGPFKVPSAKDYWGIMEQAGILVAPHLRRETIWQGLQAAARKQHGRPLSDEELLEVVTHLVEAPTPLCGHFDERYLSLPREVLTTALSEHMKCFAVVDREDRLMPLFLAVSNGDPQQGQLILKGYEKVLGARLEDAKFFFEEDQKIPLADRVEALRAVVFQEALGTVYEKTERIGELTKYLSTTLKLSTPDAETASRAALLCKADLVTLMVGEKEYSKLQGYMGQQYALASGEPPPVAQAIWEHYLPRYADDRLPESVAGAAVSIADKVDTVVGCFGVDLIPTGSQDPYALRRSALGAVRILLQHQLRVDLPDLVDRAIDLVAEKLKGDPGTVREQVVAFFRQRVESQLVEAGLDPDVADAVLAADDRMIVDALGRGRTLQDFRDTEDFQALVRSSKRVANILRGQDISGSPDEDLLQERAEKDLFDVSQRVRQQVSRQVPSGDYQGALKATLQLVKPIDDFFDQILVMDKNVEVRANRLRLLLSVRECFLALADYSKIVIKGEEELME